MLMQTIGNFIHLLNKKRYCFCKINIYGSWSFWKYLLYKSQILLSNQLRMCPHSFANCFIKLNPLILFRSTLLCQLNRFDCWSYRFTHITISTISDCDINQMYRNFFSWILFFSKIARFSSLTSHTL